MEQIITSKDCKGCHDPCCRFLPSLIDYSPIFTYEEYKGVLDKGLSKDNFIKVEGRCYRLNFKKKEGRYLLCPFSIDDRWCRIYEIAPFYCKIWPFMVMKDRNDVYLVLDEVEVCPGISSKEMKNYIKYLTEYLQSGEMVENFRRYPQLILKYDKDLTIKEKLPKIKEAIN